MEYTYDVERDEDNGNLYFKMKVTITIDTSEGSMGVFYVPIEEIEALIKERKQDLDIISSTEAVPFPPRSRSWSVTNDTDKPIYLTGDRSIEAVLVASGAHDLQTLADAGNSIARQWLMKIQAAESEPMKLFLFGEMRVALLQDARPNARAIAEILFPSGEVEL